MLHRRGSFATLGVSFKSPVECELKALPLSLREETGCPEELKTLSMSIQRFEWGVSGMEGTVEEVASLPSKIGSAAATTNELFLAAFQAHAVHAGPWIWSLHYA